MNLKKSGGKPGFFVVKKKASGSKLNMKPLLTQIVYIHFSIFELKYLYKYIKERLP